ncbi:putative F-box domain, FBD domain, leucine-rich repeat domain, L domain-containing protein [Medicago truncatula]|uniref:F-box/RNI/FBD-like domain protein n=1 Tax=Medicago truncatula TaxID=3880 RepID=G7LDU1_MEDTR|nr:FBD-associated F-box protein At4g10400-like [Medicago truncatula]AET03049.2 F-box/RNI/FBD-like domain protein [Medicago truncatula]RHN41227.1 putative F-box domain, FBD domain, leucine-rich repeat domain, L domain-containing protein [Medicago truncatula]
MAPKSISKRRQKACLAAATGGTDRLSGLPDSILCHILSFLPTRTSVATMNLVSRRWRNLWKHAQVFDFDFDCDGVSADYERFRFFVNSVLALRKSRDIQKFHLTITSDCQFMSDIQNNYVEMWICAATGPHLQELSLIIPSYADQIVKLSPSLFMNCSNLVSLSLDGAFEVEVKHSSVYFPSLKRLRLGELIVDSEVSFLSGCPMLETLEIGFYLNNIPLTEVTRLKSTNHNFTWSYFEFYVNSRFIKLGIVGSFHSMLEAFLYVFSLHESECFDPILYLFGDYNDYKDDGGDYVHLKMCHSTLKWTLHAPVLDYPEFRQLNHIKFILPCFNSNLLVTVLHKCDMLKFLIIQSDKEEHSPLRTLEPQSITVPGCLKSHLTYIQIEGYQGCEDELAFAEYILRNGLVLEAMLIYVDASMDPTNKYCSVKRLLEIPRGSAKCQIRFDPAVSS